MRPVTFKAPRHLIRTIDKLAEQLKISRSELIRRALIRYLICHGEYSEMLEEW